MVAGFGDHRWHDSLVYRLCKLALQGWSGRHRAASAHLLGPVPAASSAVRGTALFPKALRRPCVALFPWSTMGPWLAATPGRLAQVNQICLLPIRPKKARPRRRPGSRAESSAPDPGCRILGVAAPPPLAAR